MSLDTIDDLFENVSDVSTEQIMNSLILPENVVMKTEIPNPLALAKLMAYERWFRVNSFIKTADTIKIFVDNFLLYGVSHERKSRIELKEMVCAINAANNQNPVEEHNWFTGGEVKR